MEKFKAGLHVIKKLMHFAYFYLKSSQNFKSAHSSYLGRYTVHRFMFPRAQNYNHSSQCS